MTKLKAYYDLNLHNLRKHVGHNIFTVVRNRSDFEDASFDLLQYKDKLFLITIDTGIFRDYAILTKNESNPSVLSNISGLGVPVSMPKIIRKAIKKTMKEPGRKVNIGIDYLSELSDENLQKMVYKCVDNQTLEYLLPAFNYTEEDK